MDEVLALRTVKRWLQPELAASPAHSVVMTGVMSSHGRLVRLRTITAPELLLRTPRHGTSRGCGGGQ
ncbi:hypothetical protein CF319_g9151 [Tilletia indica]|nr:hypothetical protein CF319_g9151 [Tilletia indica]